MFHNILTRITNRFHRRNRGLVCPAVALVAGLGWLAGCTTSTPTYRSTDSGFKDLFDGQTLNGWMQVDQKGAGYGVTNGVIFCAPGSGGNLLTEAEYENFILYFEFKLEEGSNNGLGIRTPRAGDPAYLGMELQILDDVAADKGKWGKLKPEQFHGSVYGVAPAERGALNPPGEWNRQVVIANGRQIKVVLNDTTILDTNLNDITDPAKIAKHPGLFRDRGHLGFLGHNDYAEFRNIRIKELPDNESSNTAPEGFTSMFNGKDLTGWKGLVGDPRKRAGMSAAALAEAQIKADTLAAANWRVEAGELVYRGTNYDNLVSARDYVNFELLAEWKIEPLADSGLYLRGTPQVQIWDPFTPPVAAGNEVGSGGLFNNKTNASKPLVVADRPVGEWNQFRIIMAGDRVHVFLNGELVVNGVPLENYWQRDLPVLAYGPIELQAHKTVVWFKNLYVRELHATSR
jgi:hypothetical protein